jgi:hypothetical protein
MSDAPVLLEWTTTAAHPQGAAVALARALGLPLGAAVALVKAPGRLVGRLQSGDGAALVAALARAGLAATVSPASGRASCPAHPQVADDARCDQCRASICPVCRAVAGAALCPSCAGAAAGASGRQRLRVMALLAVLLTVSAWGGATMLRREGRTRWGRPLEVGIVELVARPAPPGADPLVAELPRMEAWLSHEFHRFRPEGPEPFHLTVLGPVGLDALPPLPPSEGSEVERGRYVVALDGLRKEIEAQTGQSMRRFDLVLYLRLTPAAEEDARFVEGAGAAGGDFGMVAATLLDRAAVLTQVALLHELLHLVGATDKYDAQGHAVGAEGLAEPSLGLHQRRAELMVGEVPTGPSQGRLAQSLDEVSVGAATAREVRWTK